ncbi:MULTISPECIES: F0F1 ATP synthase subunit epsilon [unclassified Lentilitoribacter]|jgi:F-type H+-transporting ATPase subunit epsilon|uniref:F0F1 ATP synthase subunit epsilon n=1 Tax=unclassified Lentilitoribacter TaxID=2647570 RepID=UPI0013A6B535|nr:F0F1 ATP synthase subunit epsilon [Lentilitoribacter sp. Alg239-R112]
MADTFTFELVSPEKLLLSAEVTSVVLPGSEGEMTVMANHAPTMSTVKPGIVTVEGAEGTSKYVVFGGFADIVPAGCTLLAESAVAVDALEDGELDTRIKAANDAAEAAVGDADKTRLSAFASQLEELKAAV